MNEKDRTQPQACSGEAASRGQFELNVMMPLMAHEVLEVAEVLTTGCTKFARE